MANKSVSTDPQPIVGVDEQLNIDAINELQKKKIAARDRLRAARQEMSALNAQLVKAGAPGRVIRAVCW